MNVFVNWINEQGGMVKCIRGLHVHSVHMYMYMYLIIATKTNFYLVVLD